MESEKMRLAVFLIRVAFAAAVAPTLFASASAQENQPAAENKPLVVLELFTSQGCYSCPPADKLLDEVFTKIPHLLPLEMHVDYWDDLIYGFSGKWKDPFSKNQFSRRQFAYNQKLRGHNGGYTPQMIVHGSAETTGARREAILQLAEQAAQIPPAVQIHFSGTAETGFTAQVQGAVDDGMRIASAIFLRREITEVDAGENDGKTLVNANVVTNLSFVPASKRKVQFPALNLQRQSCAAWVQRGRGFGPIVAAAKCPEL